jgi:hypothetical protein
MADSNVKLHYYRSGIAGLEVVVGPPDEDKGEVAPQTVRFAPYREKEFGDVTKVGYLATDNAKAVKALESDPDVTEIDQDEFDKATGEGSAPIGY